jgi:hypothetical protein
MAKQLHVTHYSPDLLGQAKELEARGQLEEAALIYEKLITDKKPDEYPFDRLMIIYRKLKKYKDELKVINKGIRVFEDHHKKPIRKTAKQEKLTALSNAFMKSSGLKDKKGNPLYIPEPLSRWMKRKNVVEKKIE